MAQIELPSTAPTPLSAIETPVSFAEYWKRRDREQAAMPPLPTFELECLRLG